MARPCVFCAIVDGEAPAQMVYRWPETVAFVPLNPVTPGHVLVVPRAHVRDASDDPIVTGTTFARAAELAGMVRALDAFNLITSKGRDATQTVFHLHVHLVPRRPGDGLVLPWTNQITAAVS